MFKCLYISVGTWEFDALLKQIDTEANLKVLKEFGFTNLIFQTGRGSYKPINASKYFQVEQFGLLPNSEEYMSKCDTIIGHCGAGTVLEALKKKMKIIAVNNENMMHQHQKELLDELKESGYIHGLDSWQDITPETLSNILQKLSSSGTKVFKFGLPNVLDNLL